MVNPATVECFVFGAAQSSIDLDEGKSIPISMRGKN